MTTQVTARLVAAVEEYTEVKTQNEEQISNLTAHEMDLYGYQYEENIEEATKEVQRQLDAIIDARVEAILKAKGLF